MELEGPRTVCYVLIFMCRVENVLLVRDCSEKLIKIMLF